VGVPTRNLMHARSALTRKQQEAPPTAHALCSTTCYTGDVTREISQRELRNDSGEIMRKLDEGESFVVTRTGVPVGELSPLRRHRFVRSDTAVALFRHAPAVDLGKLRDDLDRVVSQDLTPRG
jgi:antitoxin (DNA-binding transcriptional repressor) of toxin-antitoxin stability system